MNPLLLIIEDDENISLSLKVFFETKGYSVITAAAGQEGRQEAGPKVEENESR